MTKKTYYLTTAISYPNGDPHIGHAYEALAADSLARFKRLDGYDVFFLTGTDEHGLKMQQTAAREGVTPRELVERMTPKFERMVELLDCSMDDFIRTTEARHRRTVEALWQRMVAAGDIYLDKYAGWYSVRDEAYFGEDEIEERDGRRVAIKTGTPVEWVEGGELFLPPRLLSGRACSPIMRRIRSSSARRRRQRDHELREGRPSGSLGVAHDIRLGHPGAGSAGPHHVCLGRCPDQLPVGHRLAGPETPAGVLARRPSCHRQGYRALPCGLLAGVPDVGRPSRAERVFAHGFLFNRGEKMSKSVGNVISPDELVARYGVDQLRYFFLREVPFGQDGNYNHEAIINRVNADLANDLGNLAQRSLSMIARNCAGRVPGPGALTNADRELLAAADALLEEARDQHEVQAINRALDAIWKVVADANRFSPPRSHGPCGAAIRRAWQRCLRHRRGSAAGRHPGSALYAAKRRQAARSPGRAA